MVWGNKNPDMVNHVKKLTAIRKNNVALRRGKQLEMWQDDQIYSYLRTVGDPNTEVITVLNNSDQQQTRTIQIRNESQMANGTTLRNLLGNDNVTVNNKTINVTIGPKEAKVFAVRSTKNSVKKK